MPGRADRAVAVVIPAYQAAATIADVGSRTHRVVPRAIVYFLDDGSSAGTGKTAERGGTGRETTVLILPRHRGKGAALATGITAALQDGAWVIVTLDADGQHPPEEIPRVAVPVLEGAAAVVLGPRARTVPLPVGRRCTNWLSAALASRLGGTRVPYALTGLRALSRRSAEVVSPA